MENIPFEELDPCCQKEVLAQRKEKEFKEKVKKFDRSNIRSNERKLVFSKISSLRRCECCLNSSDYPLLSSIRSEYNLEVNDNNVSTKNSQNNEDNNNHNNENDNNDEDDDEFDLDLDDYKSPTELLRIEQFKTEMLRRENLQSLGFLVHLRESSNHLLKTIENFSSVPTIVHIYFSDEILSASLDLVLEKLSLKYIGTLFRRISITDCHAFLDHFQIPLPQSPILITIKEKNLVSLISSFYSFHSGIYSSSSSSKFKLFFHSIVIIIIIVI